jgi:hypothetical protein
MIKCLSLKMYYNGIKNTTIKYPIPFYRIIKNAIEKMKSLGVKAIKTDLTPDYVLDNIDKLIKKLYIKELEQGMRFFQILIRHHLAPKKMIIRKSLL